MGSGGSGLIQKLILAFVLLLVLAIALSLAASAFAVLPGDVIAGQESQKETNSTFVVLMQAVSELGRPMFAASLLILAATVFAFRREWLEAIFVLATASGSALSLLLKVLVGRARPSPEVETAGGLLQSFDQYSFPSGHVVFFVVFFGFIAYLAWTRFVGRVRWMVIAVCAALVVLIGPSRVFVGAHWASDVTGGYLIGGLWLVVLVAAYRRAVRG